MTFHRTPLDEPRPRVVVEPSDEVLAAERRIKVAFLLAGSVIAFALGGYFGTPWW